MARKESKTKEYLIYLGAVILGVLVEFLGLRFEEIMMRINLPARAGFLISLFLLIFSPLLSTGFVVYHYTGKLLEGAFLSALVFSIALIIYLI